MSKNKANEAEEQSASSAPTAPPVPPAPTVPPAPKAASSAASSAPPAVPAAPTRPTPPTPKGAPKAVSAEDKDPKPVLARRPRVDYGFRPGAVITITDKEPKFRGQRADWYERLKKSNGETMEHFETNNQGVVNGKGNPEPPRGWLRSFIADGFATLSGGVEKAEASPKED